MTSEDTHTFTPEGIPNVACPIVVTTKEYPSRNRERNRRDTAKDIVVRESVELAICADVEQAARRIVGTGRECIAVREKARKFVSMT
jgi:hypothetical protein